MYEVIVIRAKILEKFRPGESTPEMAESLYWTWTRRKRQR
jgi:hypothetical protein